MSEDKEQNEVVESADDKDDAVANSEAKGKTFDMYHVKSRVDLFFLVMFVLVMIAIFLYALYTAFGASI